MYRITFDPHAASWIIQLQVLGIFWVTVRNEDTKGDRRFPNFTAADDHVKKLGLDKVYRNYRDSRTAYLMDGGYPDRRTA